MSTLNNGEVIATDFESLVEAHYAGLFRFARSLAGNDDEAADLTQQTFLIYARKGDAIRDPSKVKSWLFTTLYREFLRTRRRGAPMAVTEPEILARTAPAVDPRVVARTEARELMDLLAEIDENYRAPMTLFYLQDLSYKEIAAVLGIPIGTVMSRLSRGKSMLKHLLLERSKPAGDAR